VGKKGCDYATLREAVENIGTERNDIVLMDANHTEAGIIIDRDVNIHGFGTDHTILQAAERPELAQERVLLVQQGIMAVVSSVTIRHGNPSKPLRCDAGIQNYGELVLEGCDIRDNAAVYGFGIWKKGKTHHETLQCIRRQWPAADDCRNQVCRRVYRGGRRHQERIQW
jgi:hypothetical protein